MGRSRVGYYNRRGRSKNSCEVKRAVAICAPAQAVDGGRQGRMVVLKSSCLLEHFSEAYEGQEGGIFDKTPLRS